MNVLSPCLEKVGVNLRVNSWEELVEWFDDQRWQSKALMKSVCFIINVVVYEVWKNRNNKIFKGSFVEDDHLVKYIYRTLKIKIDLNKHKKLWSNLSLG